MPPAYLYKIHRHEYRSWLSMITRCENPKHDGYFRYGGRGIRICRRWRDSFTAFLEDMGKRPSLDHTIERCDNDGNYEPGNCRWATRKEQQRNRRSNRMITFRGRTQCLAAWAEEFRMPFATLHGRIRSLGEATAMEFGGQQLPLGKNSARACHAKSGFKGVYRAKGRFRAQLRYQKNHKSTLLHIGSFGTAEEAARAYNDKAVEIFGPLAQLNPL